MVLSNRAYRGRGGRGGKYEGCFSDKQHVAGPKLPHLRPGYLAVFSAIGKWP